jgi:hypothetical protein
METLKTGIYPYEDIDDPETVLPMKSKKLGRRALFQCCMSRASMPFFYFAFPPVLCGALKKAAMFPKGK